MNQRELRNAAKHFERVAKKLSATVPLAESMLRGFHPIIARIKNGDITSPMEIRDIPYGYMYAEGEMRRYPELEHAYAALSLRLCDVNVPDNPPWLHSRAGGA
jgi:hypothetical protein